MRDSFVFYSSYADAISMIEEPASQMNVLKAIWDYAFREKDPEEGSLNKIETIIFSMARPTIEASKRNYENGLKGGRPRKTPLKTPLKTTLKTNDNDNDNDNVNLNDNEKDTVNDNEKENINKNNNNYIPALSEIESFCTSNNLIVNPQEFYDYYNEHGWEFVYNWKNLLKRWNSNQLTRQKQSSSNDPYAVLR